MIMQNLDLTLKPDPSRLSFSENVIDFGHVAIMVFDCGCHHIAH